MEKDEIFELAERYVKATGRSVFLTGKAGTGKTTFLKYITRTTNKRFVVLAPTGVAAINAGAQTRTYNVWEMVDEIKGLSDWKVSKESMIRIFEGGNTPAVREVHADDIDKAEITVGRNDGAVIVFKTK